MILYQKKDKVFPESIKINDNLYNINADFRNILRIFDMFKDGNITEYKKIEKLKRWFFEDSEEDSLSLSLSLPEDISREVIAEIITDCFIGFVGGQTPDGYAATPFQKGALGDIDEAEYKSERQFCYNFDAGEIYAGFLCEYGIDLIDIEFLHWYKFKILLDNLSPESAFKKKIELRFMDLSGFQDNSDGGRKFTELARAKESVQIPGYLEKTEQTNQLQEIKEFNEIWGKAGNN